MVLPAALVALGLTEAAWIAVSGVVRLIAYLLSAVLIGSYVRDVVTKTKEADVQVSEDETVQEIINNPGLTQEQKTEALRNYLGLKDGSNTGIYVLGAAALLGAAYFLSQRR